VEVLEDVRDPRLVRELALYPPVDERLLDRHFFDIGLLPGHLPDPFRSVSNFMTRLREPRDCVKLPSQRAAASLVIDGSSPSAVLTTIAIASSCVHRDATASAVRYDFRFGRERGSRSHASSMGSGSNFSSGSSSCFVSFQPPVP